MKNVILITADSLRFDHVSGEKDRNLTPFLDSMIEDGIFFDNVFSTGSGTSSSFPGILASSLPLEHGYRGLNDNHKPIAEHLQEAGIQTIGVSASTHVCSLYNYDRGFRKFRDPKEVRENTKKKDI